MSDKMIVDTECIKDPALARVHGTSCKRCGCAKAVTFINPTKDRMNLIFVCTQCTHSWRKDETDNEGGLYS